MNKHYDPTNQENVYIEESEIDEAKKVFLLDYNYDSSDKCRETLELILFYENERRRYIKDGKNLRKLLEETEKLNLEFRNKYGDWFHHNNIYYNSFYKIIDKLKHY